jgi:hypothetical protein
MLLLDVAMAYWKGSRIPDAQQCRTYPYTCQQCDGHEGLYYCTYQAGWGGGDQLEVNLPRGRRRSRITERAVLQQSKLRGCGRVPMSAVAFF